MKILRILAAIGAAAAVHATETRTWQQGEMTDFEKGSLTRLAVSSEGRITLAPAMKEIFDPSMTFLWAVARDSRGNLYAGGGGLGGSKAKLIQIDPAGKPKTLAEIEGMAIQAIAIDRQDRVYAATSPDGKVYRVDPSSGKADVFYDPKAKYIWSLAFSKSGDLFVATGDQGEIYRVTPSGTGSMFFKTDEAHARSLAIDQDGNLIVGTDPSGLILRITPAGQGFVLYQASKREITALAVAKDGTIYGAGVGNKGPSAPLPPVAPAQAAPAPAGGITVTLGGANPRTPPPTLGATPQSITGGSEVYRIQTDGYARRVWSHAQDVVYALAFDSRGRAIVGTGNRGAIIRLDSDHSYTQLLNVAPTQVTGFCAGPDGRIFAVTGNIGKILSMGPELESSGTFESDVLDAGAFTYWGRLSGDTQGAGSVVFETRSGNVNRPQKNWSEWAGTIGGRIASPSARFLQYRATFQGAAELDEVDVAYQMKNAPPAVEEIEITPANYKFPAPTPALAGGAAPASLTLPPLGRSRPASSPSLSTDSGTSPSLTWSKGQVGARWLANDENGDTLAFKLEIRGVNETAWMPLKDKIREHYYSWDSTALPDGKYVIRVTASDAPSNPPDQALTATGMSDPFIVDNTPPDITGLQATPSGQQLEVRFRAKDAASNIDRAEYAVGGGDWIMVQPTTRLSDSKEEEYRVMVDRAPGETTIAVRVFDEYENQGVAKIVVK
jgi:streptogramin lyase